MATKKAKPKARKYSTPSELRREFQPQRRAEAAAKRKAARTPLGTAATKAKSYTRGVVKRSGLSAAGKRGLGAAARGVGKGVVRGLPILGWGLTALEAGTAIYEEEKKKHQWAEGRKMMGLAKHVFEVEPGSDRDVASLALDDLRLRDAVRDSLRQQARQAFVSSELERIVAGRERAIAQMETPLDMGKGALKLLDMETNG